MCTQRWLESACIKTFYILGFTKCAQWRFRSDCANAQSDLNHRLAHVRNTRFLTFSDVGGSYNDCRDFAISGFFYTTFFILRFYGPVNPMESCRARSVYLTILSLPEADNYPSWISGRERMTVENILWSISTIDCCRPGGVEPATSWSPVGRASNWAT